MDRECLVIGRTTGNKLMVVTVDDAGHLQLDVLSLPSLPAGSNLIGKVDVNSLPSIPAGSNNIGDVDVLTLPSIPAGGALIGKVDVNSLSPLVAGSANIGNVGRLGYYNAAWQKAALPFGVYNNYSALFTNGSLPAGTSNQDFPALTANAITVITNWSAAYTGTVANVRLYLTQMYGGTGGTAITIMDCNNLATTVYKTWTGWLVCKSTDVLRVIVTGATLNDDLFTSISGFTFPVNL